MRGTALGISWLKPCVSGFQGGKPSFSQRLPRDDPSPAGAGARAADLQVQRPQYRLTDVADKVLHQISRIWPRQRILFSTFRMGYERLLPVARLDTLCSCRWQLDTPQPAGKGDWTHRNRVSADAGPDLRRCRASGRPAGLAWRFVRAQPASGWSRRLHAHELKRVAE